MNCKNCHEKLESNAQFCDNCGAKVVTNRVTFKQLILDLFITVFGVDSTFFLTLRKMVTHPEEVLNDYLNGIRKRYINPFAFLAVGGGLSLIIFNFYADEFIAINSSFQNEQIVALQKKADLDLSTVKNLSEKEFKKLEAEKKVAQTQIKINNGMMQFMLHYYNLLSFLFLIIYGAFSKWTFMKPHNFGEHIVINAYVFGFLTYVSIFFFLLAITVNPTFYYFSILLYIIYYMYVFGRFYKLSFGKNILKLLRFMVGLLLFIIILGFFFVLVGLFFSYL